MTHRADRVPDPDPPAVHLQIELPGGSRRRVRLREARTEIGSGPRAMLQVDDPRIAKLQLAIEVTDGVVRVTPIATQPPLFLNGMRLLSGFEVRGTNHLEAGGTRFVLEVPRRPRKSRRIPRPAEVRAAAPPTPRSDLDLASFWETDKVAAPRDVDHDQMAAGAVLEVVAGPCAGGERRLERGAPCTIGRSPRDATWCLADGSVSRAHCRISWTGARCWIEDRRSSNRTRLNGAVIERARLRHGDVLQIGETVVLVRDAESAPSPLPRTTPKEERLQHSIEEARAAYREALERLHHAFNDVERRLNTCRQLARTAGVELEDPRLARRPGAGHSATRRLLRDEMLDGDSL